MKLTTLILIIAIMQVSASSLAQRITLSQKNVPLSKVFTEIRKQSGFDFVFSTSTLKDAKLVSIDVKNTELDDVLRQIFDGQPLEYKINDKSIVVSKKSPSFLDKVADAFAVIDVHGRVVDEKGQPLPGVTIKLKDETQVTTTDKDGVFILKKVDENAVVVISFIGYLTKELNAKTELGIITMEVSSSKLDEVKIIAYGTTSQRLSTGNINGIKAAEIEKQPVSNPLLALSGRIPGLVVTQSSGFAGSGVVVHIQGQNSIAKGNDPFYVIDGVPFTGELLPTFNPILGGPGSTGADVVGSGNPFSFLNPADIESIDVLKDADATAIYGSRAANGAILITTKKGRPGATQVNVSLQSGIGEVAHKMKLLNTQQYIEMRKEAYINDGIAIPSPSDPSYTKDFNNYDLTVYDPNRYTDWQKELIGGSAHYTDVQTSISGGSNMTTFRINGGYHRETTVLPGNFSDVKGSVGFSLTHGSTNNKFRIQFSGNYLNDNNQLPNTDLTTIALQLPPNSPSIYNSDGSLNWARIPSGTDSASTWTNPLSYFKNFYQVKTNNLIANSNISYNLLRGLYIKTNLGYTDMLTNEVATYPLSARIPEYRQYYSRYGQYAKASMETWIIEPQLTYNFSLGKGRSDFLIGGTFQESNNDRQSLLGSNYNSDDVLKDYSSASILTSGGNRILTTYKYNALFGRFNYNWDDKYIINFTARRDGSSRFGEANRFHNFGAIGAAWLFSNEGFLKKNLGFLSYGKLRGSYGTTGNDQIGDYAYLNQYNVINQPIPYQGFTGLAPSGHSNPYLQWELTKKLQAGLDLGFLKDRLIVDVNYFKNRSSNELLSYSLPNQTGFQSVTRNFPATVENTGWEFSVSSVNIQKTSFSWTSSFNLTVNKNKLASFPGLATSTYANLLVIGQPINISKVFNYAGVNPQTGLYQFLAANGAITSTPKHGIDDYVIINNVGPTVYGGFQNSLTYKGLQFDFFFQFVRQQKQNLRLGTTGRDGILVNEPVGVLQRWQKPGDNSSVQRFSTNLYLDDILGSNYAQTDASFVRLKNASISYNLPAIWIKKLNLQNFRVFIQGENLLTFTKYIGLDPENATSLNLPPLRVITVGVQVTL